MSSTDSFIVMITALICPSRSPRVTRRIVALPKTRLLPRRAARSKCLHRLALLLLFLRPRRSSLGGRIAEDPPQRERERVHQHEPVEVVDHTPHIALEID